MNGPAPKSRRKALIVCTWDWYYFSHRRSIARMLLDAGYEVVVVTRIFDLREEILADGVRLIEIPFSRASLNPFREYAVTRRLRQVYQQERPHLVYHVAFKPVLYGSLAAKNLDIPLQVNAIAGMGQLFLGKSLRIRLLRRLVMLQLKRLFRNERTKLIVQNQTDFEFLKQQLRLPDERIFLIKGVGVDLERFRPVPKKNTGKVVIALVARLIREKGVLEMVAAARQLRQKRLDFEVRLIGDPDTGSPEQIDAQDLDRWQAEGVIHWSGFQSDIQSVYAEADIACLPSYSEGLPKSLMEACACGLPIVTTDNSGCREVVEDGVNGFLVPVKDENRLADALEKLILDPGLRSRFGNQGRLRAEKEFDLNLILQQTAAVCGVAG